MKKLTSIRAWFDALMLGSIVVMFEIWRQSQAEERKLTRFLMVCILPLAEVKEVLLRFLGVLDACQHRDLRVVSLVPIGSEVERSSREYSYLSHAIELFVTRYGTYKTFIEPKCSSSSSELKYVNS